MDNELKITTFYKGEEIPNSDITTKIAFADQETEVDLSVAIKRSFMLAQENMILRNAMEELKKAMDLSAEEENDVKLIVPPGA